MKKLLILLLFPVLAYAETVTWVNPTEREDGKLLQPTEISGYRIYHGAVPGDYMHQVDVAGYRTSTQVDLPYGDNYVVMTVLDTRLVESLYSVEVMINVPYSPPKPVSGFSVTQP